MLHTRQFLLAITICVSILSGTARSQYRYPGGEGYGGYGFGGWGGTVQGSTAAGMGAFAAGAGQYNENTAAARSMNANTAMQWNSYWQNAQHSLNVEHYARMQQERKDINAAADDIEKRIQNNPNQGDIDHGDAENAILEQLTNPRVIEGSGLARANRLITSDTVKHIPFRYAPEAAIICIDGLKNDIPDLLLSDQLKPQREAFMAALKAARAEMKSGGEASAESLYKVRMTGKALYEKVDTGSPGASFTDRDKAITYLKNLKVYLKMLKSPEFDRALKDVDQYKTTTVGHLLAFMHTYNLRFGPAKTQDQQALYRQLYPILLADRDTVLNGSPGAAAPVASPPPPSPGQFFQGVEDKFLGDSGKGD